MKQIVILLAVACSVSCGESRKERVQREEAERDRQLLIELQRQENLQRQADREQRAVETVIQGLDIITR